jgi:hypothetical protein
MMNAAQNEPSFRFEHPNTAYLLLCVGPLALLISQPLLKISHVSVQSFNLAAASLAVRARILELQAHRIHILLAACRVFGHAFNRSLRARYRRGSFRALGLRRRQLLPQSLRFAEQRIALAPLALERRRHFHLRRLDLSDGALQLLNVLGFFTDE